MWPQCPGRSVPKPMCQFDVATVPRPTCQLNVATVPGPNCQFHVATVPRPKGQFDVGSMRVDIVLVKHTPMGQGRASGVYKDDRPVSFFFVPSAGYKWQVQNKVSTVWCKRFDGSTIEDFLRDVFRDPVS